MKTVSEVSSSFLFFSLEYSKSVNDLGTFFFFSAPDLQTAVCDRIDQTDRRLWPSQYLWHELSNFANLTWLCAIRSIKILIVYCAHIRWRVRQSRGSLICYRAGIACWLELRTRDRKVASSNPGRCGGRLFFSRVNFLCWLSLGVCSTHVLPHVKDPGHSAKSAGGRLHLNTHTPQTHRSRSGLTMLLSSRVWES